MRLPRKPKRLLTMLAALSIAGLFSISAIHAEDTLVRPTDQEVQQAMKKLKADPNLAAEQKINTLRWINNKQPEPEKVKIPGWLRWIRSLFQWFAQTSRLLLWTVITIVVALIVIFLLRVFRNYQGIERIPVVVPPSFVRDLDIRPESLPDDIGAAVWQLWQQHQCRNALSLLYRGLLSRLVHQFLVPIRDSSTELQCLELARAHLQSSQTEYVSRMLEVWQFAVYGAQLPDEQEVRNLCERFSTVLESGAQQGMEKPT